MFLSLLGILLSLVVGYVAYSFTIVFSISMAIVVWKKQIYQNQINKVRSLINYLILVVVCIIYIIADAADIGNGIAASIVLAIFLLLCCLINIGIWAYIIYIDHKYKDK